VRLEPRLQASVRATKRAINITDQGIDFDIKILLATNESFSDHHPIRRGPHKSKKSLKTGLFPACRPPLSAMKQPDASVACVVLVADMAQPQFEIVIASHCGTSSKPREN
jgi:hypothetical protein